MTLEDLKHKLSAALAEKEQLKIRLKHLDVELGDLKQKIQSKQMLLPGFEKFIQ